MSGLPNRDAAARSARRSALAALGPEGAWTTPGVDYESSGRLLILGPEHRVRRAADRLAAHLQVCGLVCRPMPEPITAEMEEAASMASDVLLVHARLARLEGRLGRFDARIERDGQDASIAALAFRSEFCDLVLDLGEPPAIDRELLPPGYFHPRTEAQYEAAVEALPALTGSFEKPRYVEIAAGLCAHSASGMSGCTRCLDSCPADAIRSIEQTIRIDSHLCHGAGGCASACPTGAIRYAHPEPALLHHRLARLLAAFRDAGGRNPRLLLHDAAAGADWLAVHLDDLPGCWLPLQVEELGAAGLDLWLQALARGAAEVVLLGVGELPATILRDIDRELAVAARMLAELGRELRVRRLTPSELLADPTPPALHESAPLDRHGGSHGKRGLISEALNHLFRHSGLVPGDRPVALPASAPFGTLEFDPEGCTLCLSCVSACPPKALGAGHQQPRLSFVEDRCVQCGLCVAACPEKVLALHPRIQLDPEIRCAPRTLKEEQPFLCIRCGKPFATQSMIRNMQVRLAGHHMFAGAAAERLKMCADCRIVDMATSEQDAGLVGLGEAIRTGSPERSSH